MAQCLQLKYFSVSRDSGVVVERMQGLITASTDFLNDLGPNTSLFWSQYEVTELLPLDFKFCFHGIPRVSFL